MPLHLSLLYCIDTSLIQENEGYVNNNWFPYKVSKHVRKIITYHNALLIKIITLLILPWLYFD